MLHLVLGLLLVSTGEASCLTLEWNQLVGLLFHLWGPCPSLTPTLGRVYFRFFFFLWRVACSYFYKRTPNILSRDEITKWLKHIYLFTPLCNETQVINGIKDVVRSGKYLDSWVAAEDGRLQWRADWRAIVNVHTDLTRIFYPACEMKQWIVCHVNQ